MPLKRENKYSHGRDWWRKKQQKNQQNLPTLVFFSHHFALSNCLLIYLQVLHDKKHIGFFSEILPRSYIVLLRCLFYSLVLLRTIHVTTSITKSWTTSLTTFLTTSLNSSLTAVITTVMTNSLTTVMTTFWQLSWQKLGPVFPLQS